MPPFKGPRDRSVRGQAEKLKHQPDDKTRPPPILGWPVEPEIFTKYRRKSIAKRPYLVRHPKMDTLQNATGGPNNGGADPRDAQKVAIVVETHVDTPRPTVPHQVYSNQELIDLQCKVWVLINDYF